MIIHESASTGQTLDYFAWKDGDVWNGSAYVTPVEANIATYRIAATEEVGSGVYYADLPSDAMLYELRTRAATFALSTVKANGPVPLSTFKRLAGPIDSDIVDPGHTFINPTTDTSFVVDTGTRFAVGDLVVPAGSSEIIRVTNVSGDTLTVVRADEDSTPSALSASQSLSIFRAGFPRDRYTAIFPTNFSALGINVSGHISRVVLVDTTTTNTDMRGTNNALLASSYTAPDNTGIDAIEALLGTLADAAADGDPTSTDTVMAYIKQIINTLVGSAGIPTFPAATTPANAVSLAEVIRQIYDEVAGLNGGSGGSGDATLAVQEQIKNIAVNQNG